MAAAWKLRLRGPQGTPAELELPAGAGTTLHDLQVLASKATKVALSRLVLRAGFPPKPVTCDGVLAKTKTVAEDGLLRNRDMLIITRTEAPPSTVAGVESGIQSQSSPKTGTSSKKKGFRGAGIGNRLGTSAESPSQASSAATDSSVNGTNDMATTGPAPTARGGTHKRKAPSKHWKGIGVGNRLDGEPTTGDLKAQRAAASDNTVDEGETPDDGEIEEEPEEPQSVAELLRKHGFGKVRGGSALTTDAVSLGRSETGAAAAQAAAAVDLVNAVGSERGSQKTVHKVLRHDLKTAREKLAAESEAMVKLAAAEAGKTFFEILEDRSIGNRVGKQLKINYKATARKDAVEVVQDIPRPLLRLVIQTVLADPSPAARANLKPASMAQATPRVFWNLVHKCEVGPSKSMHAALSELVPEAEWATFWQQLATRGRKLSGKAKAARANQDALTALDAELAAEARAEKSRARKRKKQRTVQRKWTVGQKVTLLYDSIPYPGQVIKISDASSSAAGSDVEMTIEFTDGSQETGSSRSHTDASLLT